jgi:hypothetical protein
MAFQLIKRKIHYLGNADYQNFGDECGVNYRTVSIIGVEEENRGFVNSR